MSGYAAPAAPTKAAAEHWTTEPEEHDYPAAEAYLSPLLDRGRVTSAVSALRKAATVRRKAKDLTRASGLPMLPADNPHVASDLGKVKQGHPLSPVLLVGGRLSSGVPLTVADGYHRICASYHLDENADIPCRIVDV